MESTSSVIPAASSSGPPSITENQSLDASTKTHHDEEKASLDDVLTDPAPKDPNIVDFDGPDDPENPLNWSTARKTTALAIVTMMTLLSPLTSTINAAATLDILAHFNSTDKTLGTLVTSIFLLGYVFGPVIIAPLSELYGRAILYKICMLLFVVFNVACAVSNSLGSLIVFRFLAGTVGSCPVTLGTGSIADLMAAEKRTGAMGIYIIGVVLGPSIGPVIGGYITPAQGWRWTFWVVVIASGVMAIVAVLFVQESYPYVLLKRKTQRLRNETGNVHLRSALDTGKTPRELFAFSIFRPLKMLLSPIVFILSLYAAVVYGYLYLCFTTFEVVFSGQYGFGSGESGLATLGLGIGSVIGCFVCGVSINAISKHLVAKNGGEPKPEYRLPPMIFGAFTIAIGLFWYGWSAEARAHWIVPILGTGFIGIGVILTYMASSMYLVDAYTVHAASVTAATTIFRSLLGALLPLAGPPMYSALGLGWGNSLLAFISVGFIPITFVIYLYGERLRKTKLFEVTF